MSYHVSWDDNEVYTLIGAGALAGLTLGLLVGSHSKKPAATVTPPAPPAPAPIPVQDVSSTGSLNHGWMYFLTLLDGAGVGALAVSQAVFAAGFVDPSTKGPPVMRDGPGRFTALAIFNGATGTPAPQSTSALTWASVLGSPEPEVLST